MHIVEHQGTLSESMGGTSAEIEPTVEALLEWVNRELIVPSDAAAGYELIVNYFGYSSASSCIAYRVSTFRHSHLAWIYGDEKQLERLSTAVARLNKGTF